MKNVPLLALLGVSAIVSSLVLMAVSALLLSF